MSTLKSRRLTGFTLLELIVVLLVLGVLAAIAVPTFQSVKENSVERAAQSTLESAARNGEAIYATDQNATDEQIATAVEAEFTDGDGRTVTVSGDTVTVTHVSGSITATGSVEFNDGVATVTDATATGGGAALAWSVALDTTGNNAWRSAHTLSAASYDPATKTLTYTSTWDCADTPDFSITDPTVGAFGTRLVNIYSGSPDGLRSGNNYVLSNDSLVATRSGSSGSPCTFNVYLGAAETFSGVTFTDAKLQDLLIMFNNGSYEPKQVKLVLS